MFIKGHYHEKRKSNSQLEIFTNHVFDKELVNNIERIFVLALSHFSYVNSVLPYGL